MISKVNLSEKINHMDLSSFKAVSGFDAVIDYVVEPILKRSERSTKYFESIEKFGKFIASRHSLNGVIQLQRSNVKFGGNMVNCANALGQLGITVDCIGTFGMPSPDPIFRQMSDNCRLHSIGALSYCTALEFQDGKIMLADMSPANDINWESILKKIGNRNLYSMLDNADLICLANWSEILHSNDIWRGVFENCRKGKKNKNQLICVDVADFSSRSDIQVDCLVELLTAMCRECKVIMSVNLNEAELFCRKLFNSNQENKNAGNLCRILESRFAPEYMVIHHIYGAVACHHNEFCEVNSFNLDKHVVLTGGGDNFNAGLCAAILSNFGLEECLITANAVAAFYIQSGRAPRVDELSELLLNTKLEAKNEKWDVHKHL